MTLADHWNPNQYERFRREREQPGLDLISLIEPTPGARVVDLGCGTGRLTRFLHAHVGAEATIGRDVSRNMLSTARTGPVPEGVAFEEGRIEDTEPGWDIIYSNAALHWVPGHPALIAKLAAAVKPGGQLAFQLPAMHDHISDRAAHDLAEVEPFATAFDGWNRPQPVLPASDYARLLFDLGAERFKVRTEVYPHVLDGPESVIDWMSGSLLTEYRRHLPADRPALYDAFVEAYRNRVLAALEPARPFLFPFERILCWARMRA